jgi:hypothetical protein
MKIGEAYNNNFYPNNHSLFTYKTFSFFALLI